MSKMMCSKGYVHVWGGRMAKRRLSVWILINSRVHRKTFILLFSQTKPKSDGLVKYMQTGK